MSLGESIRMLRQKAFYTQENFLKWLNVALSTINRWELNKAKPNVKIMKKVKVFYKENNLDYKTIEIE